MNTRYIYSCFHFLHCLPLKLSFLNFYWIEEGIVFMQIQVGASRPHLIMVQYQTLVYAQNRTKSLRFSTWWDLSTTVYVLITRHFSLIDSCIPAQLVVIDCELSEDLICIYGNESMFDLERKKTLYDITRYHAFNFWNKSLTTPALTHIYFIKILLTKIENQNFIICNVFKNILKGI